MNDKELDSLLNGWKDELKTEQEALAERVKCDTARAARRAKKASKRATEASRRSKSNERRIERLEDRLDRVTDRGRPVMRVTYVQPCHSYRNYCHDAADAIVYGLILGSAIIVVGGLFIGAILGF